MIYSLDFVLLFIDEKIENHPMNVKYAVAILSIRTSIIYRQYSIEMKRCYSVSATQNVELANAYEKKKLSVILMRPLFQLRNADRSMGGSLVIYNNTFNYTIVKLSYFRYANNSKTLFNDKYVVIGLSLIHISEPTRPY